MHITAGKLNWNAQTRIKWQSPNSCRVLGESQKYRLPGRRMVWRSRPRFLCFNDLPRIWVKLMKSVPWGLPLTLAECSSPLSVPFYTPSHYGCLLVCWLFFPLIVFPGSGESFSVSACARTTVCGCSARARALKIQHCALEQRRGNWLFCQYVSTQCWVCHKSGLPDYYAWSTVWFHILCFASSFKTIKLEQCP